MKNQLEHSSDELLMTQIQDGSKAAFTELYYRYSDRLLNFMYRILNNDYQLAEDKLHDLFKKILDKPHAFDTSRNFKSWVYQVAMNECRKSFRRQAPEPLSNISVKQNDTSTDVELQLENEQFNDALNDELKKLPPKMELTFVLRFQEHLSIKEISGVMNCPEGTVKSRSHQAVQLLAKRLAQFNPLKIS